MLQRVHAPGTGQLSQLLAALPGGDLDVIRFPHPEVLQVLDLRPLLDSAAAISARYAAGGLLIAETLAAGLVHGHGLWFGAERNVGQALRRIAADVGIDIRVVGSI